MEIYTIEKRVEVSSGDNGIPISAIPSDYIIYALDYENITLTDEDIENIFQWTNVQYLGVSRANFVGLQLQQHSNKLERLANLKMLLLYLSPAIYGALRAPIFIESLKSLEGIIFFNEYVTAEQYDEFVKNQKTPNGWDCDHYEQSFACSRK